MKSVIALVLGALIAAGSAAVAQQPEDPSSPTLRIAWEDFKKLYDDKKTVVIDVRGADAFAAGHIPGARSIPLAEVEKHADELKKLKQPIVLYCA